MTKILRWQFAFRAVGLLMGLISIFGGLAAWETGGGAGGAEPERYLVSTLIMLCSGILWLIFSIHPKLELTTTQYKWIVAVLALGLFLSLFYSFKYYSGECGYTAKYGYPGYWLINWRCTATSSTAWWDGTWRIDFPSFIANIVFWSGIGLMFLVIWNTIKLITSAKS